MPVTYAELPTAPDTFYDIPYQTQQPAIHPSWETAQETLDRLVQQINRGVDPFSTRFIVPKYEVPVVAPRQQESSEFLPDSRSAAALGRVSLGASRPARPQPELPIVQGRAKVPASPQARRREPEPTTGMTPALSAHLKSQEDRHGYRGMHERPKQHRLRRFGQRIGALMLGTAAAFTGWEQLLNHH